MQKPRVKFGLVNLSSAKKQTHVTQGFHQGDSHVLNAYFGVPIGGVALPGVALPGARKQHYNLHKIELFGTPNSHSKSYRNVKQSGPLISVDAPTTGQFLHDRKSIMIHCFQRLYIYISLYIYIYIIFSPNLSYVDFLLRSDSASTSNRQ